MRPAAQPVHRRAAVAGVVLAVAFGCWARLVTRSPLWLDEALTVNISRLGWSDIPSALLRDGHPPLYYWLLHGWMELFGSGDLAVRSLSALFSVATLPVVWQIARRAGGASVAWWALVLLALSPFAVRYGTEARMYSLVMLLVAVGALLLEAVLDRPTVARAVALGVVTGALLWTHYWSIYLLAVVGAGLVVQYLRRPSEHRGNGAAVGALLGGGVLFLPWVPKLLEQAAHTGTPWATPARPAQVVQAALLDLGGGGFGEGFVLAVLLAVAATFVVVPVEGVRPAEGGSGRGRFGAVRLLQVAVATMAVGTGAAFVTSGGFAARYGSVVVPFALTVVAAGLVRIRPLGLQRGLAVGLVVLSVVAVVHNAGVERTQSGQLAETLAEEATPTDLVVVCPDQLGPDLDRAMAQAGVENEVLVYPDGGDPAFVDWRDYEERNAGNDPSAFLDRVVREGAGRTIWVVWQGGYRTLLEQCEKVVEALSTVRQTEIVARNKPLFEAASLWRFAA